VYVYEERERELGVSIAALWVIICITWNDSMNMLEASSKYFSFIAIYMQM
jgi:hypothetical protein